MKRGYLYDSKADIYICGEQDWQSGRGNPGVGTGGCEPACDFVGGHEGFWSSACDCRRFLSGCNDVEGAGIYILDYTGPAVAISDELGSLHQILTTLEEGNINLEYLYDFNTRKSDYAYLILKVDEVERAVDVLSKSKIKLLSQEDLKTK